MNVLHLHVRREYWEQVRDGTKRREFRRITPHWQGLLEPNGAGVGTGRAYDAIAYHLGYPKRGDPQRTLMRKWNGWEKARIRHKEFGPDRVTVYAIDVSEPLTSPR